MFAGIAAHVGFLDVSRDPVELVTCDGTERIAIAFADPSVLDGVTGDVFAVLEGRRYRVTPVQILDGLTGRMTDVQARQLRAATAEDCDLPTILDEASPVPVVRAVRVAEEGTRRDGTVVVDVVPMAPTGGFDPAGQVALALTEGAVAWCDADRDQRIDPMQVVWNVEATDGTFLGRYPLSCGRARHALRGVARGPSVSRIVDGAEAPYTPIAPASVDRLRLRTWTATRTAACDGDQCPPWGQP